MKREIGPNLEVVVFDMDGAVTRTTRAHAAAWKRSFDEHLRQRRDRQGSAYERLDRQADHRRYVDGKRRYEGVRSFLESRGIALPWGDANVRPDNWAGPTGLVLAC